MEGIELVCEMLPWEGKYEVGEGYVVLVQSSSFGIDAEGKPFYSFSDISGGEQAAVLLNLSTLRPALEVL